MSRKRITGMSRRLGGLAGGVLAVLLMTLSLGAQPQQGRRNPNADVGADFSPKPPIKALSPERKRSTS
jgi:hypothetical protein